LGSQPAPAPERAPRVLVMWENGWVMSQRSTHGAEASSSRAVPPAPVVADAHPERGPGRASVPPAHFDEA
jgi:hypothetical protein